MMQNRHVAFFMLVGCGFPRPADVGDDQPGDAGGSSDTGVAIHVSPSGDDTNDGLTRPVKTLKHALALVAANAQTSKISLASGLYSADSGEVFPYTVPANVLLVGPPAGGAILAGDGMQSALVIRDGSFQDLEFENFGVVIDVSGIISLTNIHIRGSNVAVHGHAGASLVVSNLDVTGSPSACASGIVLSDTADLRASTFTTQKLGTSLDSEDHSTSDIGNALLAGDPGCTSGVIKLTSDKMQSVHDSTLNGGNTGFDIGSPPAGPRVHVVLTNVTVSNTKGAMGIGHASVEITGGEFTHNGMNSQVFSVFDAALSLLNVKIIENLGLVMYAQKVGTTLRGCTVTGNEAGIDISVVDPSVTDLGTAASPGGNTFQSGPGSATLIIEGTDQPPLREVDAIGNTWNPNVQGADSQGRYDPSLVVAGSSTGISGGNYSLTGNMISLRL